MSIKRYDHYVEHDYIRTECWPDGEWVRADDHEAEVERLTRLAEISKSRADTITQEANDDRIAMYDAKGKAKRLSADLATARALADRYMAALSLFLHRPPGASYHELLERARAALAALPTTPEQEGEQ